MDAGTKRGVAKPKEEDPRSPTDKLVEGLREIVREELEHPAAKHTPKQQLPSWRDAFWLAVFVGDVTLIFSWFPEEAKGSLEFIGKFLPWFLGGLFVVANDWFREHLLEISRIRWLRVGQITFLVFGLILGRIPFIPLTASVGPPGTVLTIDEQQRNSDGTIWLTIGYHKVTISEDQETKDKVAQDREFKLAWWQLLSAAFIKSHKPDWRLVYKLDITTSEKTTVTVTKKDGPFDSSFLDAFHLHSRLNKKTDDGRDTLQFQSSGPKKDDLIELPYGTYSVEKPGCKPSKPIPVDRSHLNAWNLEECLP